MKIAVLGDAFVDICAGPLDDLPKWGQDTPCQQPIVLRPGGSALNTAVRLATFDDAIVMLHSAIGTDEFGQVITRYLDSNRVKYSIQRIETAPTGTCIVLSAEKDRAFVTHYGAARVFTLAHVNRELLNQATHLHIAGFYSCTGLMKDLPELIAQVKSNGCTISMDTNYDGSGKWSGLNQMFPFLDVFLPNETEAALISKETETDRICSYFQSRVPLTIVTLGSKGVQIISQDSIQHVKAKKVEKVIDPTGAGDAFNAGFLYGWAIEQSIEKGIQHGLEEAAKCIQHLGAVSFLDR